MSTDDEISYQKKRDIQSFRHKRPSEYASYKLMDLAEGLFQVLKKIIQIEDLTILCYFFTRSMAITCFIFGIKRTTFYDRAAAVARKYRWEKNRRRRERESGKPVHLKKS